MISSWLFPHAKFKNVFVFSPIALTFAYLLIISFILFSNMHTPSKRNLFHVNAHLSFLALSAHHLATSISSLKAFLFDGIDFSVTTTDRLIAWFS